MLRLLVKALLREMKKELINGERYNVHGLEVSVYKDVSFDI